MITREILTQIAPKGNSKILNDLHMYLNLYMPQYGVDNYLRIVHFLAQAAHETDGFKTLEEYASGAGYEGRKDLGNIKPGDGKRYKGRGIFQVTGRYNYRELGAKLGLDLENNPELALDPRVSVLTALEYWNSKGLSQYADKDDILTITKKINGGTNGLASRQIYLDRAKKAIPKTAKFDSEPITSKDGGGGLPDHFAFVLAQRGDESNYVQDLQVMLNKKGASIQADGKFGEQTETAVSNFQKKVGLVPTGKIDTNTVLKLMEM